MADFPTLARVSANHRLVKWERRGWWCSCLADCLNTEGSFDRHLEAEWVKARTIETVEQLDTLPFLSIVREAYGPSPSGTDYGAVWERRTSGWHCIAGSVMPPRDEYAPRLRCRVLYAPEVDR
jgi:hypothetical protein